jgi:hypothetical protein
MSPMRDDQAITLQANEVPYGQRQSLAVDGCTLAGVQCIGITQSSLTSNAVG